MRVARRRAALAAFGAEGPVLEELLAYGEPLLPEGGRVEDPGSLADEAQVAAWCRYEAAARAEGAVPVLARVFRQLRFPIRSGVSQTESYRAATRRGEDPEPDDPEATGLPLRDPEGVALEVASTVAGRIPILVARERGDFEALVRALSARNEPVAVPPSMGACLVRGLPNWDRVESFRVEWMARHPDETWDEGFAELAAAKELWQDRFILLSTGPYSGVEAATAGFGEEDWRRLSLAVRREHEATHYLTLRAAGTMRTNLLDELIADWAALERTFGRYDPRLALSFFGLEEYPAYREGGRLQNYRGGLSAAAFLLAQRLVHEAVAALARADATLSTEERSGAGLARRALRLAGCALDELAAGELPPPPLRLAVAGDREGIAEAMARFDDAARDLALGAELVASLRLVLDEVLSNQVKYGWEGAPGSVELRVERFAGVLELEFVDDGRPFDVLAARDPDTSVAIRERPIGGLGIYLVKKLTDEQRYERREGKNRLLVRKRI